MEGKEGKEGKDITLLFCFPGFAAPLPGLPFLRLSLCCVLLCGFSL